MNPQNVKQQDGNQKEEQNSSSQTGPLTGKPVSSSSKPMTVKAGKTKKAPSAFRTISEVAKRLDVQQHVLRFWETKFSQVRPLKRGGGRRYYRPEDIRLLEAIHHLLYTEGYTIKGVQKLLKENGKNHVIESTIEDEVIPSNESSPNTSKEASDDMTSDEYKAILRATLEELKTLREMVLKT